MSSSFSAASASSSSWNRSLKARYDTRSCRWSNARTWANRASKSITAPPPGLAPPRPGATSRSSPSGAPGMAGTRGVLRLSPQLFQQRLGLLQVSGVEALGEPAIDRGQQLAGLGTLALLLPEATQAHGGPQLERFGLLAAGDVQSPLQPDFRLRRRGPRLPQEHDAAQATHFRFPEAFLVLLHQGVGLGQRLEAVFHVAQVGTDFRQQGAQVWDV